MRCLFPDGWPRSALLRPISCGRITGRVAVSGLAHAALELFSAPNLNPRPGWQVEFRPELKVCGSPSFYMAVLSTVKATHSQKIANGKFSIWTIDSYIVCPSEGRPSHCPLLPVPPAPLYHGASGTVLRWPLFLFLKIKTKVPKSSSRKVGDWWVFQRGMGGKEWPSLSVAVTIRDARPAWMEMRAYVGFWFWRLRPMIDQNEALPHLSWQEPLESEERGTEVPLQSPARSGWKTLLWDVFS